MTVYGFKDKQDVLALKPIARQQRNRPDMVDQSGDFGGQPRPSQSVMPVRALASPGAVAKIFFTPEAGIPAMAVVAPGSNLCRRWDFFPDAGIIADSGEDEPVKNLFSSPIAGETFIITAGINSENFAIAEDCPVGPGPTAP